MFSKFQKEYFVTTPLEKVFNAPANRVMARKISKERSVESFKGLIPSNGLMRLESEDFHLEVGSY